MFSLRSLSFSLSLSLSLCVCHQYTLHHHVINPFTRIKQCSAACSLPQLKVIRQMSNCLPHATIRNRRNTRHVFVSGREYAGRAKATGRVIFDVHQIWFGVICAQFPRPRTRRTWCLCFVFLIRTAGTARYVSDRRSSVCNLNEILV